MTKIAQKLHPATANTSRQHLLVALPMLMLILVLVPTAAWAQSADIAGAGEKKTPETSDDSSQHVEESEEAYRRRMETAESHDQGDVMRPRPTGTSKAPEGIDALPADSRKHLRDELRNVIIEQGEWQPADVNNVYPYSPSAAAEEDPQLRKQEEQAWGELIAEYHKREAAALAAGGGRVDGSEPGEGQEGSGQQGQAGSSSGSAASRSSSSAAERAAKEAASSTAAGMGVSQSALEFLKSGQASTSAGKQQSPSAEPQPQAEPQPPDAVAQAAADKPKENKQEKSAEAEPPPPPGSLAIAELVALEDGAKRQASAQAENSKNTESAIQSESSSSPEKEEKSVPSVTLQSSGQPPPPPGAIAIPELEKLQGMDEAAPLAVKLPEKDS